MKWKSPLPRHRFIHCCVTRMLLFNCPVGRILNIIHNFDNNYYILVIIIIWISRHCSFFFFNSTPTVTQSRFQTQTCKNNFLREITRFFGCAIKDCGMMVVSLKPPIFYRFRDKCFSCASSCGSSSLTKKKHRRFRNRLLHINTSKNQIIIG